MIVWENQTAIMWSWNSESIMTSLVLVDASDVIRESLGSWMIIVSQAGSFRERLRQQWSVGALVKSCQIHKHQWWTIVNEENCDANRSFWSCPSTTYILIVFWYYFKCLFLPIPAVVRSNGCTSRCSTQAKRQGLHKECSNMCIYTYMDRWIDR